MPHLWKYIEEGPLASDNNLKRAFHDAPMTYLNSDLGLAMKFVPIYSCPSDGEGQDITTGQYRRRRGNYVVNWGNQRHTATEVLVGIAPFSAVSGIPRRTELADVIDGTSKTLMMSEALKGWARDDNDHRGDFMNDDAHFRFYTSLTPNTSAPDVIRDGFFTETGDPLMPGVPGSRREAAARSRHPSGVNAAFCDGSARFFSNDIDALTWRTMGTMDGGEVTDDAD